jgi:hypothetical protein
MPPVRVSYDLHACMCELIFVKFRDLLHRRFDEHCSILWSSSGLRIPDSKSLGGTLLLLPEIAALNVGRQYWVGPFLGSILGSTFYALCKQ